MNNKQGGLPSTQPPTTGLESLQRAPSGTSNTASVSGVSAGVSPDVRANVSTSPPTNSRSRFSASFAGYSPAATPSRSSTPGVVNQPSGQSASSFKAPKRPMRPWKKQALLLSSAVLFVSLLGVAALRLNHRIQQSAANQDVATSFKPIANPVLGEDSLIPVQSLNDKTVTINGDLTVTGKLNLSAQAITDLAGLVGNKVALSPTLGGPTQAGNILLSGSVLASNFQGNGANLSNLNASSITTGTLDNARLDPSVTRLGQTIPLSVLQSTVVSSLNGLGGTTPATSAVQLIGSGTLTVTTNPITNQIVLGTTGGGDITGVIAGSGLTGGGLSGDVTLNVDTGIVTVQGNVFNGANQLVQLNGAGELPVISAINLTNLNASNIGTGTLNDARLSANVTLQGNTFNLPNKLVQLDNSGNLPAVDGSALTNLSASNIGTGTLNDARLSANVALLSANQTFTGNVVFSQPLTVNVIQPSATMTIGATNQSLTLQGDLTTRLRAYSGVNNVSLGFSGTPTGNVIYNLDASTPAGTYTLCTSVGNCASAGGGVTTLGGTTNQLVRFTGAQSIGDSSISDNGTLVTVAANGLYKASADSTTAFRVQNAAGSSNVFTADTTNSRVAIGQATAGYTLDVAGDINSTTGLRVAGNLVCDATGCAASNGSGFYIQNSTTTQTAANFNIESTSNTTPTAVLKQKTGQTADLLQARDSSNNVIAKIDANGNISTTGQYQVNGTQISSANLSNDTNLAKLSAVQTFTAANLFQNASNSTTAFRIQNAAASNLFVADTTNSRIAIGQATAGYTLDVNGDINITTGNSYRINGVAICGPTATCAPSSGSTSYVQNGLTTQTANMNIQSSSSSAITAIVQGATGQTADLLQARDSTDNVVARITSSGAIYQGTNQVCDTSNNCNYASGSGSGNYIQNGTTTQTANMNIQSASASQVTAVIQGTNAQTANILEVKDGTAQANTIFSVNQNTSNLISNGSFETDTSGWSAVGLASIARSTVDKQEGNASLALTSTTSPADSVKYDYPLAPFTTYTLSFQFKRTNYQGLEAGYSVDGSTRTVCVQNGNYFINYWTRQSCTFTTGAVSGTPYVYIKGSHLNYAETVRIDAVQLQTGSIASAFQLSQVSVNGVITSPIALRPNTDSSSALMIQNAAGMTQFMVNTATGTLCGGTSCSTDSFASKSTVQLVAGSGLKLQGNGNNNVVGAFTQDGSNGKLRVGASCGDNFIADASTGVLTKIVGDGCAPSRIGLQIVGAGSQTGDLMQIQSGSTNSNIVTISQNNNNLITNPTLDTNTSGWSSQTSATVSRITTDQYSGLGSLSVATAASASSGVRYNYNLLASTTYSFSVYVKATGSNFSTLELGYSADGSTQTSCVTAQTVTTTGWNRYTCTFTTTSVSGTRFVYIKQTDATARTFYIDAAQLEASSSASAYRLANIALNGTISSPAVFQNQSNSSTAFQVQNAAGSSLLTTDTLNGSTQLTAGSAASVAAIIQAAASQSADLLQFKHSNGNSLLAVSSATSGGHQYGHVRFDTSAGSYAAGYIGGGQDGGGNRTVRIYGAAYGVDVGFRFSPSISPELRFVSFNGQSTNIYQDNGSGKLRIASLQSTSSGGVDILSSGTAQVPLTVRGASGQTADILQVQDSASTNLFSVGATGSVLSKNSVNSATAFQIQNATGTNLFGVNTSTGAITLGSTGSETGIMNISTGTGAMTVNLGTGGAGSKTINIGTGAVANGINIGNTSSSIVEIKAGNYFNVAGGHLYMNACNSCLMQIGLNGWQQYISIGNSSGNTSLTTNSGTGGTAINSTGAVNVTTGGSYGGTFSFGGGGFYLQSSGNVVLGGNTTSASVTLGPNLTSGRLELGGGAGNAMTGNIDIGIGNGAQTLNFGTGSAAKTINIGGITTTTNLNLKVGATAANGVTVLTGKTSGTQNLFNFTDGSGDNIGSINIDTSANSTTYNTTSDKRLKENITETHYTLDDLLQISVTDYNFITDPTQRRQTGFLAQDLHAIFPDAVKVGGSDPNTDPWAVDYGRLTPLIVKSVQQLNSKVDNLSARVDSLQLGQAMWNGGIVSESAEFKSMVSFDAFVTFKDKVTFKSDVDFEGRVTFADKDLAGTVTMIENTKTVHVEFGRPYSEPPIVTVTPKDSIAGYAVKNVTATGFDITTPTNISLDVDFNWIALPVKQ